MYPSIGSSSLQGFSAAKFPAAQGCAGAAGSWGLIPEGKNCTGPPCPIQVCGAAQALILVHGARQGGAVWCRARWSDPSMQGPILAGRGGVGPESGRWGRHRASSLIPVYMGPDSAHGLAPCLSSVHAVLEADLSQNGRTLLKIRYYLIIFVKSLLKQQGVYL